MGATVTAIIPNWNGAGMLACVLDDLAGQTLAAQAIVVDNGSTDDSVAVARGRGARVIALPSNAGFAAAVNRGIAECATEWTLVLNNDVRFGPEWLETLVAGAGGHWFAVGKLLSARDPGTIDGTWDLISRGATAWRAGSGRADGAWAGRPREIAMAPLTAALIRTELFRRAGPLDEAFGSYLEDVDFGLRCAAAGYRGVYVPAAVARHYGSATLGEWRSATVFRNARNQVLLTRKHFHGAPRWPLLAGQLLWGLLAAARGQGRAWARGRREGGRTPVAPAPGGWQAIRELVAKCESEIYSLQDQDGFDTYWRWYFRLVGGRPPDI